MLLARGIGSRGICLAETLNLWDLLQSPGRWGWHGSELEDGQLSYAGDLYGE